MCTTWLHVAYQLQDIGEGMGTMVALKWGKKPTHDEEELLGQLHDTQSLVPNRTRKKSTPIQVCLSLPAGQDPVSHAAGRSRTRHQHKSVSGVTCTSAAGPTRVTTGSST